MRSVAAILLVLTWIVADAPTAGAAGDKVGTFNGSILIGGNAISAETTRDFYKIGLGFQGQIGYTLSEHLTLLPVVVTYATFSGRDVTNGTAPDDLGSFSFSPSFRINVDNERNINPFVVAGVGLYKNSDRTVNKTKFGVNGGFGSEFAINNHASLFAQSRFHKVFADEFTFVDFTFGVNFYMGTE